MANDYLMYFRLLRALLPRGRAWQPDVAPFKEILEGKGVELARVDSRADNLLVERDTRTTSELLAEFKTEFGLPDNCQSLDGLTDAQIRTILNARLRTIGSMRPNYYIALAETLGYGGVSIDEYIPFWCGLGVCGDPCGDQQNLFYWTLKWTYDLTKPEQDGSDIECLVDRFKPAHTVVTVKLVGPGFDNGFSNGFYAYPAYDLSKGGGFSRGFNKGFDVKWGGGFTGSAFSDGFDKPYVHFGY